MKTRFLIVAVIFALAITLWIIGISVFEQVKQNIWESMHDPKTIPGSSGGGFPSYDGIWIYFETGSVIFAIGIFLIIWKRSS